MLDPKRLEPTGRYLLAAAFVAFGVQALICLKPTLGLEPLPVWLPAVPAWAALTALVLIVGGVGIAFGKRTGLAAAVLGGLLMLWVFFLHVPKLIASPVNGGLWTCLFETLAIASAAWAIAGAVSLHSDDTPAHPGPRAAMTIRLGRLGYGVSLPVFGVLHVIYWQYIVSVLPAWLPWPLFWTYFTAAAFFAAGAAIVSGLHARLAATCTGIMFLSWVLILHAPRVAKNADSRAEWTSLLVALAMGGGAWVVGDALRRTAPFAPSPSSPADHVSKPLWRQSL